MSRSHESLGWVREEQRTADRQQRLAAHIGAASVLGVVFLGVPVTGQAEVPSVVAVEEVVVTARKREESLRDVPVAATAFTAEKLEQSNVRSVADIASMTPGLQINVDSPTRAFIAIRGVGATFLPTVQPGVGLFIDGIYQPNTSYLNNPALDIERIEVLRGPQGTLYGKNTLGGAINVISRQPTDELQGMASAGYSWGDDSRQAAVSISGPLVRERVHARIAASTERANGFFKNKLVGGDAFPTEYDSVNGSLRWQLAEPATLVVSGYYLDLLGGHVSYGDVPGPRDYVDNIQMSVLNRVDMRYYGINAKLTLDVPQLDSQISAIVAYDARDSDALEDGDFTFLDLLSRTNVRDLRTRSAELRMDTRLSDSLSLLVGAFASRRTNYDLTTTTLIPLSFDQTSTARGTEDSTALFTTLFWNLSDELELTAGLRYDREDLKHSSGAFAPTGELLADPDAGTRSNELEPRVTLTKRWPDNRMVYASIARGYRGGGINSSEAPQDLQFYEGDSVWTYEVGSKLEFLERRLYLATAFFYNDYENYIGVNGVTQGRSGGLVGVNFNTGDVESYGLEVELSSRITPAWALNASATLMKARVTDQSGYLRVMGEPLGSDRLLFQPDWSFNLETTYDLDLRVGKLVIRAALTGKGDRDAGAPFDVPPALLEKYFLTDASITFERDALQLSLYGSNLLDEKYFEAYIDGSALSDVGLPHSNLAMLGDGRRVGLRAKVRF